MSEEYLVGAELPAKPTIELRLPTVLKLLRDKATLEELRNFLPDWRMKSICENLKKVTDTMKEVAELLNPPVEGEVEVDEETLAQINKAYYAANMAEIIEKLDELTRLLLAAITSLFRTEPLVIEEADLAANMKDLYTNYAAFIERLEESLINLATTLQEPYDVMRTVSMIHTRWTHLSLLLNHRLIDPLTPIIREKAKNICIVTLKTLLKRQGGGNVEH